MADGRVIIEAILDTVNVQKNVKNLGKQLDGISWKNIAAGDEKAQALAGAFKGAGVACTASLTTPIVAAGRAAFSVASDYVAATSWARFSSMASFRIISFTFMRRVVVERSFSSSFMVI